MSRPMVSPNCPFTARASADSLEVSTPLLLRSSSYHPTSCSRQATGTRQAGSGRRWEAAAGRQWPGRSSAAAGTGWWPDGWLAHAAGVAWQGLADLAHQGLEHDEAHAQAQLLTHVVEGVGLRGSSEGKGRASRHAHLFTSLWVGMMATARASR